MAPPPPKPRPCVPRLIARRLVYAVGDLSPWAAARGRPPRAPTIWFGPAATRRRKLRMPLPLSDNKKPARWNRGGVNSLEYDDIRCYLRHAQKRCQVICVTCDMTLVWRVLKVCGRFSALADTFCQTGPSRFSGFLPLRRHQGICRHGREFQGEKEIHPSAL